MQKTPSYLKGLAETRARAAADVLRYQQIIDEVMVSLARAQAEVDACDMLIRKFDDRLDPTQIEPVAHWKGRYGKRGALKEAAMGRQVSAELILEDLLGVDVGEVGHRAVALVVMRGRRIANLVNPKRPDPVSRQSGMSFGRGQAMVISTPRSRASHGRYTPVPPALLDLLP